MKSTLVKILVVLLLACAGAGIVMHKKINQLEQKTQDQSINIRSLEQGIIQYKDKYGKVYTRIIDQRRTAKEIEQSKDTTIMALRAQLFAAGIKLKDVVQIGSTKTRIELDTVLQIVQVPNKAIDTVFDFSRPPFITNKVAITPTAVSNQLRIYNTQSAITHVIKEGKNGEPLKKFFLWRWFQPKRSVAYTDITNTNKYIEVEDQVQITVLDKDGQPKQN